MGEEGGVQKLAIWGDFQGVIGATGGGRVVKNRENWGDVVYGWSLNKYANYAKMSYHNHFKTGPSISYVQLFRGVGG